MLLAGCAFVASGAQAQDYSQIDWSTQVANLRGESGPAYRVDQVGDFGCELTYFSTAEKPEFVIYQVPDILSFFTLYAPESWLTFEGKADFSFITAKAEGDENKLVFITQGFERVDDPNRGPVLRVQNGFDFEDFRGVSYMNFYRTLPKGASEAEDKANPSLEWKFNTVDNVLAIAVFEGCLAWTRRQPEWQEEFGQEAKPEG